jgi:hypothetical protein
MLTEVETPPASLKPSKNFIGKIPGKPPLP